MNKVMLDLETMGNSSNAAIVAIGAVRFDNEKIIGEFYVVVDLKSSVEAGMEMDPATVMWWMRQSQEARKQLERNPLPLSVALINFRGWLGDDAEVWGNGAAFDNVILGNAYRKCHIEQPWEFWNDRCYRTVKALNPHIQMQRQGVHHKAVDDARSQAEHLIKILNSK